jgi:bifunctional non-homologous end joining protein LigD
MARVRYRPQLATLVAVPPSGSEWVHEIKFDGYRIGATLDDGNVRLESRRDIDWTSRFPEVVAAVSRLPIRSAVLDGEVAILQPNGRTSFQALQNVFGAGASRQGLRYFVFDLLALDDEDWTVRTLEERKRRLLELLPPADPLLCYSQHFEADGPTLLARATELGAEGIVSKLRADRYRAGRSTSWLKAKCIQRQLFVIGGFTEPQRSRSGLGALLLGVHRADGAFVFCGGVGTGQGWTADFLKELRRGLNGIEQPDCPFLEPPPPDAARGAHWVRPLLVCEVAFTEWTDDGTLRHPSFQTFKPDEQAADVRREDEPSSDLE